MSIKLSNIRKSIGVNHKTLNIVCKIFSSLTTKDLFDEIRYKYYEGKRKKLES